MHTIPLLWSSLLEYAVWCKAPVLISYIPSLEKYSLKCLFPEAGVLISVACISYNVANNLLYQNVKSQLQLLDSFLCNRNGYFSSQNHSITESQGLERTSKNHPVNSHLVVHMILGLFYILFISTHFLKHSWVFQQICKFNQCLDTKQ